MAFPRSRSISRPGLWLLLLVCSTIVRAETAPYAFGTLAGLSSRGQADGVGANARFNAPTGVAIDGAGNLYVADSQNHVIRKITPDGRVATLAGRAGEGGQADGRGADARLHTPTRLAVDGAGNVFVCDTANHAIRRIAPDGTVTTWAGAPGLPGFLDGPAGDARFSHPQGIAIDAAGTLYVADSNNHCIRKISPAGIVSTWSGTGLVGRADGAADQARFTSPSDLALDRVGNLYAAEQGSAAIRKIAPDGSVSTLNGPSGQEMSGLDFQPSGLAVDAAGALYRSLGDHTIWRITLQGVATLWTGVAQSPGSSDGSGSAARYYYPSGLTVDAQGNVFVADAGNNTIRKITPAALVTTVAGIGRDSAMSQVDGPAGVARFRHLSGVALGPGGEIYAADSLNNFIRRISPEGAVTTLPVTLNWPAEWGPFDDASSFPLTLTVDRTGNLYYADSLRRVVKKITPGGSVTTLFQGPLPECWLTGITTDRSGNVYFADNRSFGQNFVRKISPDGTVSLFTSHQTFALGDPYGGGSRREITALALDDADNVYIAYSIDPGSPIESSLPVPWLGRIKKVSQAGVVTHLAGGAADNFRDGPAASAGFAIVSGMAIGAAGRLIFTDESYGTVRALSPDGIVSTLAGLPGVRVHADGVGREARFRYPSGVVISSDGKIIVPDGSTLRQGRLAAAPVILSQPQNLGVTTGGSVQFSVMASAAPDPAYQWFFNGAPFTGATSSTLSFTSARATDAGEYTVAVTNSLGTVTSAKAMLVVTAAPAQNPTPNTSPGGTGGGGAPSLWFLGALIALAAARRLA